MAAFFEDYDLLLTPTLSRPPVPIGSLKPSKVESLAMQALGSLNAGGVLYRMIDLEEIVNFVFDFIPYTPLANASGCPAMSAPLYWNEAGLPIGVQFMAPFGDEATLFRLAGQLERARPWFDRAPRIEANAST
jgi:amidase